MTRRPFIFSHSVLASDQVLKAVCEVLIAGNVIGFPSLFYVTDRKNCKQYLQIKNKVAEIIPPFRLDLLLSLFNFLSFVFHFKNYCIAVYNKLHQPYFIIVFSAVSSYLVYQIFLLHICIHIVKLSNQNIVSYKYSSLKTRLC